MNVAFATNDVARSELRDAKPFVTVEGRALAKALQVVNYVIERRNTYPILACARLELRGSTLRATGTDLDIEVTVEVDVNDATGAFVTCLDGRALAGIARVAGTALLRIEPISKDLVGIVVGDREAAYEVIAQHPDSFPLTSSKRGRLIERFPDGALAAGLARVSHYISTEETRYYLNGVAWQLGATGARFVATDGHRLASYHYSGPALGGNVKCRIIPRKTVVLLERFGIGQDASMHVVEGAEDEALEIVQPGLVVRTKLIVGTYPDTDRVTPKPERPKHAISLRRVEAVAAIKRAAVMSQSNPNSVYRAAIRFFDLDGKVAIGAKHPDHGEAIAPMSCPWPVGASEFGMNSAYLLSILDQCQGDVTLEVSGSRDPLMILDEDRSMTRVLMPMRV